MQVAGEDLQSMMHFTREDLETALHGAHWIPALRGGTSHQKSKVFDFLPRLKTTGVLVRDRSHFTGLRVCASLVAVELLDDGTTVRYELHGCHQRTITIRPKRA